MKRGLLIVIEGIDGAGTTTQSERLAQALTSDGLACHATREPSTGPVGRLLREILDGQHQPVDGTTLGLLFAADRADHLQREIVPELQQDKIVITDRYYHSSLAYQGAEEDRDWIAQLNQRAIKPDLVLFLRVDPEIAAQRRQAADRSEELFDQLETQKRVAAGYEAVMAQRQGVEEIEIIDGHQSLDEVTKAVVERVRRLCSESDRRLKRL